MESARGGKANEADKQAADTTAQGQPQRADEKTNAAANTTAQGQRKRADEKDKEEVSTTEQGQHERVPRNRRVNEDRDDDSLDAETLSLPSQPVKEETALEDKDKDKVPEKSQKAMEDKAMQVPMDDWEKDVDKGALCMPSQLQEAPSTPPHADVVKHMVQTAMKTKRQRTAT